MDHQPRHSHSLFFGLSATCVIVHCLFHPLFLPHAIEMHLFVRSLPQRNILPPFWNKFFFPQSRLHVFSLFIYLLQCPLHSPWPATKFPISRCHLPTHLPSKLGRPANGITTVNGWKKRPTPETGRLSETLGHLASYVQILAQISSPYRQLKPAKKSF